MDDKNFKKRFIFLELMQRILDFRERRDWAQFHDPKNLAEAIAIESGELLEHFLWKSAAESREVVEEKRAELASELADILTFSFLFAHEAGIDIHKAIIDKMNLNEERYPVEKAKGTSKKYKDLK